MDLDRYLRAVRKSWWVVLIFCLIGAGGSFADAKHKTPIYAAHVTFFVSTPASNTSTAFQLGQYAQAQAISYAEVLSTERLAHMVLATLHLPADQSRDVQDEISGAARLNTVLIDGTVTDPSPARALRIAHALETDFPALVAAINKDGGKGSAAVLQVVSSATVSNAPISPRTKLDVALGLAVGLFLGLIFAGTRELLDNSIRSKPDLQALTTYPVVGAIERSKSIRKAPLLLAGQSAIDEQFRELRTNLTFLDVGSPLQVLIVTSSVAAEGKTTVAANLALIFSQAGESVLLIDADLRRPTLAGKFSLEGSLGLTNVLAGQVDVRTVLQQWGERDLTVLASGPVPPNPSELLGGSRMAALIAEVRPLFDRIIIDASPLLPVTDAAVLSQHADGALVLFRYGKTKRSQIRAALDVLRSANAAVAGVILSMTPARQARVYGYQNHRARASAVRAADLDAFVPAPVARGPLPTVTLGRDPEVSALPSAPPDSGSPSLAESPTRADLSVADSDVVPPVSAVADVAEPVSAFADVADPASASVDVADPASADDEMADPASADSDVADSANRAVFRPVRSSNMGRRPSRILRRGDGATGRDRY